MNKKYLTLLTLYVHNNVYVCLHFLHIKYSYVLNTFILNKKMILLHTFIAVNKYTILAYGNQKNVIRMH